MSHHAEADIRSQSIRDDLEHIHQLENVALKFMDDEMYISLNFNYSAVTARSCMHLRLKYKPTTSAATRMCVKNRCQMVPQQQVGTSMYLRRNSLNLVCRQTIDYSRLRTTTLMGMMMPKMAAYRSRSIFALGDASRHLLWLLVGEHMSDTTSQQKASTARSKRKLFSHGVYLVNHLRSTAGASARSERGKKRVQLPDTFILVSLYELLSRMTIRQSLTICITTITSQYDCTHNANPPFPYPL